MATPVNLEHKIVPISVKTDNSNVDTTSKKVLRTVGKVLSLIGEYVLKTALGVLALLGIFVITVGAPMSWLAFPLYIIMGSGATLAAGKGLETFNEKRTVQLQLT